VKEKWCGGVKGGGKVKDVEMDGVASPMDANF